LGLVTKSRATEATNATAVYLIDIHFEAEKQGQCDGGSAYMAPVWGYATARAAATTASFNSMLERTGRNFERKGTRSEKRNLKNRNARARGWRRRANGTGMHETENKSMIYNR
jgi:hypothetical protein